jgi:hypothetical protein
MTIIRISVFALLSLIFLAPSITRAYLSQTISVPTDAPTIQAAINLASDGDLVLVAPGIYQENIQLAGKTITLASQFHTTQNPSFIDQTIIDGGGNTVITVDSSVGPDTKIIGFTIRNGSGSGNDGIKTSAKLHILNNHFINNNDAIDYSSGGGVARHNVFENNGDDAVDFDNASDAIIEDNIIRNNGDDGIEIRMQPYSGPTLNIIIRRNTISGNAEDGIQLIDYPGLSNRVFYIERNLITNNAIVGLGLMDGGVSDEDAHGASIPERIHLYNNTFVDNPYAVTGGNNLIALNNLFVNSTEQALLDVDAGSIVAYNLFWNNGTNHSGSNIVTNTTRLTNPLLGLDYHLQAGSPAIDAGTASFTWNSQVVLNLQPGDYAGVRPDLGAYETHVGAGGTQRLFLPIILKTAF